MSTVPGGVSVVIPAHDEEATIGRAVRSVQAQTSSVLEIIVVNDHSTDGTTQVVRELADQDPRVRLLDADGIGSGHARNVGVAAARGELIAFLDADDVWYPDKVETQLPLLTDDIAFVGALVHYLGEDGSVLGSYLPFDDWDEASDSLREASTMPVSLAFSIVRRSDLLDLGGFDETFLRTQDLELAQRLVADGRRVAWPLGRALGGYLLHAGGVSAQTYEEQFLAAELVRARVRGETTASYQEWQESPVLSAGARRALRSGRHYRLAAVAQGSGNQAAVLRHGVMASLHDPVSVAGKLLRRRRHVGSLEPEGPPPEIVASFRGDPPSAVVDIETVNLAGLELAKDPEALATAVVKDYLADRRTLTVMAAHVTSLNSAQDPDFVSAFNASDARHVDGISWSLLARAGGEHVLKRATTDLAPRIIEDLALGLGRPVRLAVIGGEPSESPVDPVARRAGERLARERGVELVAAEHGFHDQWSTPLSKVREAAPDVVLVGMGMPLEARWVRDHVVELPPSVVITCGGWLRILAGDEDRAPRLYRRYGLEWLHRLTTNPSRTATRYVTGSANLVRYGARELLSSGSGRGTHE